MLTSTARIFRAHTHTTSEEWDIIGSASTNSYWINNKNKKRTVTTKSSTINEILLESAENGQIVLTVFPPSDEIYCALASEVSLAKEWLSPEEDAAWEDL